MKATEKKFMHLSTYKTAYLFWLSGNSSCSGWLGYTLKRKLANRENPLTRKSADIYFHLFGSSFLFVGLLYKSDKYI